MDIKENALLAPLTTFQIGGPARYLVPAQDTSEVVRAFEFAKEKSLPVFILGGGSNLLVSDDGFYGVVIKIELKGVEIKESEDSNIKIVLAAAGEGWDALVARTCQEGLWGIENLSGIPGTVGGAVVQNIGAYGSALSETLTWVEALNSENGEVKQFSNAECAFGYRDSFFKHNPNWVVLRAAFTLHKESTANLGYQDPNKAYKDLSRVLATVEHPTLSQIRDAVLSIRSDKFPNLQKEGTAGSFFKNPILSATEAQVLKDLYPELPLFPMPETPGMLKIPIAWLMDKVLTMHGLTNGGARLFEKQILVIAATRNTKAGDVKTLAATVQKQIKEKLNIEIEPEVKII